jgi:hypothetical protein
MRRLGPVESLREDAVDCDSPLPGAQSPAPALIALSISCEVTLARAPDDAIASRSYSSLRMMEKKKQAWAKMTNDF